MRRYSSRCFFVSLEGDEVLTTTAGSPSRCWKGGGVQGTWLQQVLLCTTWRVAKVVPNTTAGRTS